MHSAVPCVLLLVSFANAARGERPAAAMKNEIKAEHDQGIAASAAEMPPLANLLEKANWIPTPELSGVFQAGAIFEDTAQGHALLADGCIERVPLENTYTAAEVVSSLQAGVQVRAGAASLAADGALVKKIKFSTPTHFSVPTIDLVLSESCNDRLSKLPRAQLERSYVIREVLRAMITEQTCGRIGANGRIVGLGAAEAEFAAACSQESLDPVAVGYRIVPLTRLIVAPSMATPSDTDSIGDAKAARPSGATGPFILVLSPGSRQCVWTLEDAPTGRSASVFASRTCPDEISWQGPDDLYFNDGDALFSLVAGDPQAKPVMRPVDSRCDAEGTWGSPHRSTEGGLQWACFSEVDGQFALDKGKTRLCSGDVCVDAESGIWDLAIPVLVKTYIKRSSGDWVLESAKEDCVGTEGCLVGFDRPPAGDFNGVSLARLYDRAQRLALEGTAPDAITDDPSIAALLGLDAEESWVEGAALGSTRYVLWSRHTETQSAYGPAVVVESNGLRRITLDLPDGIPFTTSVEGDWAVLAPYGGEGDGVLVGPTGDVPARTWPAGTRAMLLPYGVPTPLGVVP